MGKRSSSNKLVKVRRSNKLPSRFECLFCNHREACGVTLDKKTALGNIMCSVCGVSYQVRITGASPLQARQTCADARCAAYTQPIDVYSEWQDACENVAQDADNGLIKVNPPTELKRRPQNPTEFDDFIVDVDDDKEKNVQEAAASGAPPKKRRTVA